LNEGHFANFAENWLPWQHPLSNWKILATRLMLEKAQMVEDGVELTTEGDERR